MMLDRNHMEIIMKIEWKSCFKIAVTVFFSFLVIKYWDAFTVFMSSLAKAALPLTVGLIAAYIINILMSSYESLIFGNKFKNGVKFKIKRMTCIILAIITLVGIAALVFGLVIPELISCIKLLIAKIPDVITKIIDSKMVRKTIPENILAEITTVNINWQEHITNIASVVVTGIGDTAKFILSTVTSVFSGIITAIISIILTFYILFDKERIKGNLLKLINCYVPKSIANKILYCLKITDKSFRRYIVGQCTEAVIIGALCTITMLIFRLPYAGMVGALIAFTALIPIAGAYIGAGVGALMILTESPFKALVFLIMIIILQQIEGNIIYPKVVGKSIGLPALWVLVAVTVGGGIAGIAGMLIGVPITATVYRIVKVDVYRRSAVTRKKAVSEESVSETAVNDAVTDEYNSNSNESSEQYDN